VNTLKWFIVVVVVVVSLYFWCAYDQVERLHRQWNGIDSWLNSHRTFSPPIVHRNKKIWYDLYRSNTNSFFIIIFFCSWRSAYIGAHTREVFHLSIPTRVYVYSALSELKTNVYLHQECECYIINNYICITIRITCTIYNGGTWAQRFCFE